MRFLLLVMAMTISIPAPAATRLAQADSPYLRIHGDNPVDWYPWGDEAFAKAKAEDKPVFLSIGYSSCYWCQVAEETLYRNPAIAARMNAGFVNVKVDREQRPDLDRLYMTAAQLLGSGGGWPNNLVLTPDRQPFFAGGYFPPEDNDLGQTGFPTVLERVTEAWKGRRGELLTLAGQVTDAIKRGSALKASGQPEPDRWRRETLKTLRERLDEKQGGLRSAGPAKFPQVPALVLLASDPEGLRGVRRTLDAMALSSLRDHLDGGFHRYTVDPGWSQPHFEKMLYDNAQLLWLYAVWGESGLHSEVARETGDFLLRAFQAPEGGFYASFDAVSEGHEGAHYLWGEAEIRELLGSAADEFLALYRITPLSGSPSDPAEELEREPGGALRPREELPAEGLAKLAGQAPARALLLERRKQRPAPARDEKIILAWNGLAIEALAEAGVLLPEPRLVEGARRAAERLWQDAWEPGEGTGKGRLRQALFEGKPQGEGFLEDYALFGIGLLALAQATGEDLWRRRAIEVASAMLGRFGRPDGGLADTLLEAELFAPPLETGDGSYPSGPSAAHRLLLRLAATGEKRFGDAADRYLRTLVPRLSRVAIAWPALLADLPERIDAPFVPGDSAEVVKAGAQWQGNLLRVELEIAPGWHLNANPASRKELISTRLSFEGAAPKALRYPASVPFRAEFVPETIQVYEGRVVLEAEFAGQRPSAARLEVQACSDKLCLPPAKVPVPLR